MSAAQRHTSHVRRALVITLKSLHNTTCATCSEVPEFGPAANALLDRLATSFSVEEAQEVGAGLIAGSMMAAAAGGHGLQQRSSLCVPNSAHRQRGSDAAACGPPPHQPHPLPGCRR